MKKIDINKWYEDTTWITVRRANKLTDDLKVVTDPYFSDIKMGWYWFDDPACFASNDGCLYSDVSKCIECHHLLVICEYIK